MENTEWPGTCVSLDINKSNCRGSEFNGARLNIRAKDSNLVRVEMENSELEGFITAAICSNLSLENSDCSNLSFNTTHLNDIRHDGATGFMDEEFEPDKDEVDEELENIFVDPSSSK